MQRFQSPRHRHRQERRQWQHVVYTKWAVVALIAVVGFFAHATHKMYQTERDSFSRRQDAARQRDELAERDRRTREAVAWTATADGQEYLLRTKYAVGKPGEELYVLVDPPPESQAAAAAAEPSFWEKFLEWFRSN